MSPDEPGSARIPVPVPVLGFVVNPVAGLGGRLGLKGSDDQGAVARAGGLEAESVAPARARRALAAVRRSAPDTHVLAAPGAMGADLAEASGLRTTSLELSLHAPTTAADTSAAAEELARREVDLILFAGGDGTARDIARVVGTRVPVVGVPAGVKMRSGVFGTSPEAAGETAGRYLAVRDRFPLVEAEILDAADGAPADSELHGIALVPELAGGLQRAKSAAPRSDDAGLASLCAELAAALEPGRLYLLGPGTTTGRIMAALGLPSTLLGVDAVQDGRLVAADLDEHGLLALLDGARPATLVLGVIGSQGFLLGRGNQQISPEVVRRVGPTNVLVVAGAAKVLALQPPVLRVDLGDAEGDPVLSGYLRVHMAPGHSTMLRVAA